MLAFWKRPSFWTGLITIVGYWDWTALNGKYVYDDAGSVLKNVVVNGQVPWKDVLTRDFWGQEMKDEGSHKSFRPITTATFKLNYDYAKQYQAPEDQVPPTLSFHLVNVGLHGLVTALITEATWYILPDLISQLIVGFLFGLHPVHAEAVSNITSRGEMIMSLFFCLAFLSFASSFQPKTGSIGKLFGIYIMPWCFMTLSMFSKEQGATTLISLVLWDFLQHHGNVVNLFKKLKSKEQQALNFLFRTFVLAIQTLATVYWRYLLNGPTKPDFIEAQNPAGFAPERFTRAFSVNWVYCLYIRDAIFPYYLCPDWSGRSIDLIRSLSDPRAILVVSLWYFSASSFWSMFVGLGNEAPSADGTGNANTRRTISTREYWKKDSLLRQCNMAVWAFAFAPFLLSSNILVVVGLMKADRVIYLPLFGFCLLEAALLQFYLLRGKIAVAPTFDTTKQRAFWLAYFFVFFQLTIFCSRTHERNLAWSDPLRLWETAHFINPKSYHTRYNYGYELSMKQRYAEAEPVLRPVGDPRVEGPTNTFVYTMVLANLKQCDRAHELLDDAFEVINEKRREGGTRNSAASLSRTESNLLVSRATCTENMKEKGRILYNAVEVDPTNDYAVGLATQVAERLKKFEELQQQIGTNPVY